LDPADPNYGWRDEGEVFASNRRDDYNAIDPNFVADEQGRHWLAFGSFWTGLKMLQLDPLTGKRAPRSKLISIAQRPAPGAVEAPYIIRRGRYYYLFASYDFCCRGADSNYYTIVGRSKEVTGPYLDADGKPLLKGYGQIVLHAKLGKTGRWRGPGHVAVLKDGSRYYIVYHAYDAQHGGIPTLRITELGWTADGWPVAKY
jgi:arabinan endo-1,5-alpha-L-arabinosidase